MLKPCTTPVFLAIACAAVCGCVTARCRVNISNATDDAIRSVLVADAGGNTYSFSDIAPHTDTRWRKIRASFGRGARVNVVDGAGKASEYVVDLDPPVLPEYRGRLWFEIQTNGLMRTFFIEDENVERSIGWSPSWQGALSMPGQPGNE